MNDKTNGADGAQTNGNPDQASSAKAAEQSQDRPMTRAEQRIAALEDKDVSMEDELEQLAGELEIAERRAAEAEAGWQRARADFANLKRRTEEQRAEFATVASDRLLVRVLDLADDFDLAVEHVPPNFKDAPWVEGIGAIDRKLRALLEAEGITPMGGEGEPFDPQTQQAISYEDTADVPDGTVVKILQRGFTIGDRVLRPALVAVARNDDTTDTSNDS